MFARILNTKLVTIVSSMVLLTFLLTGCNSKATPVVNPIQNFDAERYMGTWYEILRLPHSFEKNLVKVTAEYRLNEDGTVEVTNRGFNSDKRRWKTAIGLAKPIESLRASFDVTFFWPFSGGYYIAELGQNYEYAVVVSDNHDYFWLLSRTPKLSQGLVDEITARAYDWGFDIDALIHVAH